LCPDFRRKKAFQQIEITVVYIFQDCTLESCFYHFTMPEILNGSNKFGCEVCTKRQNAAGDGKLAKFR